MWKIEGRHARVVGGRLYVGGDVFGGQGKPPKSYIKGISYPFEQKHI